MTIAVSTPFSGAHVNGAPHEHVSLSIPHDEQWIFLGFDFRSRTLTLKLGCRLSQLSSQLRSLPSVAGLQGLTPAKDALL